MLNYRILITFLTSIILLFSYSMAQEENGITIATNPPGATIYLRGELDLVANSPARLPINISGRYRAEITRPGYETWKGDLTFVPGSSNNVAIKLSKKTRAKAMIRSIFIPGWGQVYSENKIRGYLITAGAVVAAASIYYVDRRFDKEKADFDLARANYLLAKTIEERIALKAISDDKQNDAYNAETDRNAALIAGASFWAYNVLDALIFFPDDKVYFPTVTSLGDGLALTYDFNF